MEFEESDSFVELHAHATETHLWRLRYPPIFSRAQVSGQTGAYQSAVVPAISKWSPPFFVIPDLRTRGSKRCAVSLRWPCDQPIGEKSPTLGAKSSILLCTGSTFSSPIGQLSTSARQLASRKSVKSKKSNACTVIVNMRAMEAALQLLEELNVTSVLSKHRELLRH